MPLTFKTAALAGLILSTTGYAFAQDTIIITPEQRTVVREYVVRERIQPVPSIDYDIAVGSIIPDTVEVQRLDGADLGREFEYVQTDRGTVLIDPTTRRVVDVID